MAKTPPVSSPWIPEDDLLLKNSVEAGASLEALAKGAVKFSRRYTFRELRDRWHSLLYDPDTSTQASSSMVELEISGSNPSSRFGRLYNSKGSEKVPEKRKGGSIRGLYYAMRKKMRSEYYGSSDLGFLEQPNRPNCNEHGHNFQEHAPLNNEDHCGDSMVGDCFANNLGLQETDIEILRQAFGETIGDISTTSGVANAVGFRTGFHSTVEDNNPNRIVRKDGLHGFSKDVSPLIGNATRSSLDMKMEPNDETHTLDGGSNGFGKCLGLPGRVPLQTPDVRLFETNESPAKQVSNYDSGNDNNHVLCSGFGGKQHFNSPVSDGSASFHTMGFSSPLPRLPLWKTMEDVSAPDMPLVEDNRELPQGAVEILHLPDDSDCRRETTSGYDAICSSSLLIERPDVAADFINPHVVSEGEFTDLPDSLLNFSNEDELLFMDVDGKDTMDKSCYDTLNSLLLGSPSEVLDSDLCKVEHKTLLVSNSSLVAGVVPCPDELKDIAPSVHGDQQKEPQVEVDVPSTSVLNSEPLQLNDGKIICVLNTEDTEIPCNDDIFLLIHPGTSFASSSRKPITTDSVDPISSSADEKDGEKRLNLMNKGKELASSSTRSHMVRPKLLPESVSVRPLVGCAAKSELLETKPVVLRTSLPNKSIRDPYQSRSGHAAPMTIVTGVLEKDLTKVEPRVVDSPAIHSARPLLEPGPVKLTIPESIANPSTSDQDECESDGDVPYYSDLEAMILDMDLAYDQDSCLSREVARYQHEDTKRTIIRLEQTANSSMQRAMTSKGAFAILYGRRLKHYIHKTEVTLGRSTDNTDVDIDLRREGRAHKISRQQIISDNGSHFEGDCDKLLTEFKVTRHKSSPYRPQTNGAVEAANKTLERIIKKMAVRGQDWPEKLHLALWGYRTSVRTATGETPFALTYGMEAVLPIELEIPSLRVLLENAIFERAVSVKAIIKMETDGSFSLKNLGKNPISVNGKAIASGHEFALSSNCLIEIKGMSFVFEINAKYVRRYLDNLMKQSQGKTSNLEWLPEEVE